MWHFHRVTVNALYLASLSVSLDTHSNIINTVQMAYVICALAYTLFARLYITVQLLVKLVRQYASSASFLETNPLFCSLKSNKLIHHVHDLDVQTDTCNIYIYI